MLYKQFFLNLKFLRTIRRYGMILQNPDVVSEKSPKWGFCPLISFREHVAKFGGHAFYCRRTYVLWLWQRFEKIGAETEAKPCLEKKEKKTRRKI